MKQRAFYIGELDTRIVHNGGAIAEKNHLSLLKESFEVEEAGVYVSRKSKIASLLALATSPIPIFYSRKEVKRIREKLKRSSADLVFIENANLGYFARYAKKLGKKVFVFAHNCEILFAKECRSKLWHRSVYKNEKMALAFSECVYVMNERDVKDLKRFYPSTAFRHEILPPFHVDGLCEEDRKAMETSERKNHAVFIGSYFKPNIEAVEYINSTLAPQSPDIIFDIFGFGMDKVQLAWAPNVINHGTAKSMNEVFVNADFVLFPIFSGSGMKIKTEESLMYGKYIIASDEALEGYDVTKAEVYRCKDVQDYVRALRELKNCGTRFSQVNRLVWEKDHSFQGARVLLRKTLEECL